MLPATRYIRHSCMTMIIVDHSSALLTSVVRVWFSRVIFLWDLGINLACSPIGQLSARRATAGLLEAEVHSVHQQLQSYHRLSSSLHMDGNTVPTALYVLAFIAPHLPFTSHDPDSCVFDSLVALAVGLQVDPVPDTHELERITRIQLWLDALPFQLRRDTLPLLILPAEWPQPPQVAIYTSPQQPASASRASTTMPSPIAVTIEAAAQSRSALARIIRVLYFALTLSCYHRAREAIWLDLMAAELGSKLYLRAYRGEPSSYPIGEEQNSSPGRPLSGTLSPLAGVSVRETSLRAAMMNFSDAADYLVHHKLFWLWPFTEQIIWLAQRVGLCIFSCGLEGWYRGFDNTVSLATTPRAPSSANLLSSSGASRIDSSSTSSPSPEEPNIQAVVQTAAQMVPDGPHQTILRTIQAVLVRATNAVTYIPSAARHRASVRVLSAVASAASARAPELSGEGTDGTQAPEVRREGQGVLGLLGPNVLVGGARRDIAGGAAMGRALAGRK